MSLILREQKGSKLTIQEMDGNLIYLEGYSNDINASVGEISTTVAGLIGYPYTVKSLTYKTNNYTLIDEDLGKLLLSENDDNNVTITIPKEFNFTVGDVITIIRTGNGTVKITAGDPAVIILSSGNKEFIANKYESIKIICTKSGFFVIGDLSVS